MMRLALLVCLAVAGCRTTLARSTIDENSVVKDTCFTYSILDPRVSTLECREGSIGLEKFGASPEFLDAITSTVTTALHTYIDARGGALLKALPSGRLDDPIMDEPLTVPPILEGINRFRLPPIR